MIITNGKEALLQDYGELPVDAHLQDIAPGQLYPLGCGFTKVLLRCEIVVAPIGDHAKIMMRFCVEFGKGLAPWQGKTRNIFLEKTFSVLCHSLKSRLSHPDD